MIFSLIWTRVRVITYTNYELATKVRIHLEAGDYPLAQAARHHTLASC